MKGHGVFTALYWFSWWQTHRRRTPLFRPFLALLDCAPLVCSIVCALTYSETRYSSEHALQITYVMPSLENQLLRRRARQVPSSLLSQPVRLPLAEKKAKEKITKQDFSISDRCRRMTKRIETPPRKNKVHGVTFKRGVSRARIYATTWKLTVTYRPLFL